jgi:signal transduction histidine kinase
LRQPRWLAEIDKPANRAKLRMSIWSGYAVVAALALLAFVAGELGVVPHTPGIYALIGVKVVANTLAWVAHLTKRGVLPFAGLNTVADLICLTGAIYYTGGPLSPLFVTYVIEITVFAFFTNRVATALVASLSFTLYALMLALVYANVLPVQQPPAATLDAITLPRFGLMVGYAAFVLGATTWFTTGVLAALESERRALKRRTEELIEAGQQKSHFMANVTHELRTPIHGITGLTDLLEAEIYGPVTEEQRGAHHDIRESAKGLLRMVDDLLSLSRAEVGKLELQTAPVPVEALVEAVTSSVSWMVGTKSLELTSEVAPDATTLISDRGRLSQILVNLLANAVKFTPEGGRVHLSVTREGDALCFAVSDTGIGISPADQAAIFEPFRQVDGGDERQFGGVGLGLSLVTRLVTLLAGTMRLESEIDAGSTFTVVLPLEHPSHCAARATEGGDS